MSNLTEKTKISLRNLDDVDCANIVVPRQIRKLIRKFPSLSQTEVDCWISLGNAIQFINKNDKLLWKIKDTLLSQEDEDLSRYELNKLLVFTFRAMCEMNEEDDLSDSPEDLLAYAEMRLKELLADEGAN